MKEILSELMDEHIERHRETLDLLSKPEWRVWLFASAWHPYIKHDPCQEAQKELGSLKARPRAGGKLLANLAAV